jgi:hypothetical protein
MRALGSCLMVAGCGLMLAVFCGCSFCTVASRAIPFKESTITIWEYPDPAASSNSAP